MEQYGAGNTTTLIITLIIFITPLLFAWLSKRKRKKIEAEFEITKERLSVAQNQVEELTEKYSSIIDIELHTQQLLGEAEEASASNISQSEIILAKAEAKAKDLSITSHSKAEALVTDAELEVVN
ncbi:MAG: putative membrane protein YhiD involved in acid resistance, partial [Psychroserpens sp.]